MFRFLIDLSKYFRKPKSVLEVHEQLKSNTPKREMTEAERKGIDTTPEVYGYINPFIKVGFEYQGKELTSMPLCFLAHAYLKDYGFNPDSMISGLKITLTFAQNNVVKLPFYLQQKVNINDIMTPEQAKKAGLVL